MKLPQRVAVAIDATSTMLWPLPTFAVAVAVGAGIGLPRLDGNVDDRLPSAVTDYLFGGGPQAARSVLSAIATSLMTVTSLTFSLTVVTLQLASSQFSPRLLRTFVADRFVQSTLALFLATFTYTITILRTVRSSSSSVVPQIAVTLAFVLTVASVIGLVLFLGHLARQIRIENIGAAVHRQTSSTIRLFLSEREPQFPHSVATLTVPEHAKPILTSHSGFLQAVREEQLVKVAEQRGQLVWMTAAAGDSVIAGTPIGWYWPDVVTSDESREQNREEADTSFVEEVNACLEPGRERTAEQDVAFGLRQLTDVVIKALSPGINDPTTAVHTLAHSSALLCECARRDLGPRRLVDGQDRLRVVLQRPDLEDLLALVVDQPRLYGKDDPAVLERLLHLLREVAFVCDTDTDRKAVAGQLARTRRVVLDGAYDEVARAKLLERTVQVEMAIEGRWPRPS